MYDTRLHFEALYFPDRLHTINPTGDVGVVTLWTPIKTSLDYLKRIEVDLDPDTSRISVIGNLYGDGLPQLLCNLLWNPQIKHLLVFGQDLSGSSTALLNLLTIGVEESERFGVSCYQIRNTTRYLDISFPIEYLVNNYSINVYLKISNEATTFGITTFFKHLGPQHTPKRERIKFLLPVNQPSHFPSETKSHSITRATPLDAWEEVVCRLMRFGVPSIASKTKKRLELLNLKVVITDPIEEEEKHLQKYGFSLNNMHSYQEQILDGTYNHDLSYTYGNRLRGWWCTVSGKPFDQLTSVIDKLFYDLTTRGAYITLWDPKYEGEETNNSQPCLISLFFRYFEDKLTLTATFRAHNTMSAWLKNIYGLMAIQQFVANGISAKLGSNNVNPIPCGAITVLSHSISIDPTSLETYDLAKEIVRSKTTDMVINRTTGKKTLREDPNGYFAFTIDRSTNEIVVEHRSQNELLATYRGKTAEDISGQLSCDNAISDISHALYVGRTLVEQEALLKKNKKYY